jgi:hypothetical protein
MEEYEKLPDDKKKIIDDLILALRASDKQWSLQIGYHSMLLIVAGVEASVP